MSAFFCENIGLENSACLHEVSFNCIQKYGLAMRTSTFLVGFSLFIANLTVPDANARQDYVEEDCHLTGISSSQRCFTMTRPREDGGIIEVGGVILPSDAVTPLPDPLVILTGGPGQAASDAVALLRGVFRETLSERDLVFLDIRGTGRSNPVSCRSYFETYPPLTYAAPEEAYGPLAECYAQEGAAIADANTATAAADLEALRQHLGVEQLNIWGVSYGTRLAQYYAAHYGSHVRSLVLDGVVPFNPAYIDAAQESAAGAVKRLLDDCHTDAGCSASFPEFDLYGLLDQIEGLKEITYRHPVTGRRVTTRTNRETVAQVIFGALYTPASRAAIPYALTEAVKHDNWAPLAVLADDTSWYFGMENIYTGARLSVLCAEEDLSADGISASSGLFKDWGGLTQLFRETCARWPVEGISLPSPEPGSFKMPTVMISGAFDPITPPSLARNAEGYYVNLKHIVLQSGGHFNSPARCVTDYINAFIADPEHLSEEPDCLGEGHFPDFVTLPVLPFSGQEEASQ